MFAGQRGLKSKEQIGTAGEQIAARHLKKKKFRIVERNYRCKLGEIDIVATKGEYLVFVEVKTRNADVEEVNPLISITKAKCRKLRQLGSYFMLSFDRYGDMQPRFDIIGVTIQRECAFVLEHIESAF